MKLTAKLIVNVVHHGLGVKKNFSCSLPKTALNSGFLPFYLTEKTSDLHLVLEEFLKNRVKNQLKKICGIPHTRRRDHLCLYRSSANETLTISRNVL